ncbi:lamin tail domain-containing protein, partial [Patescibacteria group bacterium]|nr:lamin tail domain-containing protein [Patescibacteria group bacterium]
MLRQTGKIILILSLLMTEFFYLQKNCQAVNIGDVVINEVAWMGTTVSFNNEWLELKNTTNNDINLEGWSLIAQDNAPLINLTGIIIANGYFLLERTDDASVLDIKADVIYNGVLGNDGETLGLRDKDKNLIDFVDANNAWLAGNNTEKKTMERKDNNNWQTSLNINGTPRAINSVVVLSPPPLLPETPVIDIKNVPFISSPSSTIPFLIYKLGDALINEFVVDPADNDVEWIEICNLTNQKIDLSNWTIEDSNKTKTNLSGFFDINNEVKFKVIEKPTGILNNNGDLIILRDGFGNLIDQVVYGDLNDGDKSNNAPTASDPFSIARKFDCYNSFNNQNDFILTTTPTKNKNNIITLLTDSDKEISPEQRALFDYSQDIFISEIFPNPTGDDAKLEFIEIYNASKREVNLTGWSLSNENNEKNNFEKISTSTIIKAGEYLSFFRQLTKIVMYNDQGEVKLFQPLASKPIQIVKYKNVIENQSYNLILSTTNKQKEYIWSETVTPSAINIVKTINHLPKVNFNFPNKIIACQPIIFDSSDTFDQDNDNLKFSWDFGDGIKLNSPLSEHTFLSPGTYTVSLTVSDGQGKVKKEKIIKVIGINDTTTDSYLKNNQQTQLAPIIINEFLPNPVNSDINEEWIELYNQSNAPINLVNWQLDDNKDNSLPYEFLTDLWLDNNNFLVINRQQNNLVLNNTNDAVRLFNDFGELIDIVEYKAAVVGKTYARDKNNKWFWTNVLTPGEKNIINASKNYIKIENKTIKTKVNKNNIIETTLTKVSQHKIGDIIKIKGKVVVLPGILGEQYFYIVGSPSLQIYNYKKNFPNLKIGDYIEVVGELTEVNGEPRLKIKDLTNIKILEHQKPPIAQVLTCDKFDEEYIGQLVSITGEVTDRKGSTIYFDDGDDEIMLYIKRATDIKSIDLIKGKTYTISGIVVKTQSGLKLMPRSKDDIVIKNLEIKANDVLGEVITDNEWEITDRNKKLELFVKKMFSAIERKGNEL